MHTAIEMELPLGQLYTFHISHFEGISWVFSWNTPRNTKHSPYTFRISCEFRVLLMPQRNKPRNPVTFRTNADPGAKCKKRRKKSDLKYTAIHILFLAFCDRFGVFHDECITGLKHYSVFVGCGTNEYGDTRTTDRGIRWNVHVIRDGGEKGKTIRWRLNRCSRFAAQGMTVRHRVIWQYAKGFMIYWKISTWLFQNCVSICELQIAVGAQYTNLFTIFSAFRNFRGDGCLCLLTDNIWRIKWGPMPIITHPQASNKVWPGVNLLSLHWRSHDGSLCRRNYGDHILGLEGHFTSQIPPFGCQYHSDSNHSKFYDQFRSEIDY